MTRDPRQDPRPGDVLRVARDEMWLIVVVVGVDDIDVSYVSLLGWLRHPPLSVSSPVKVWRRADWSGDRAVSTATVLYTADSGVAP